ncbi:MAG: RidA family protein [Planctomycetota bacterium]
MSARQPVTTTNAPKAVGPYSQAVVGGGLVYCSGQVALDPATGKLVGADVALQTERVLENLQAVLVASGSSLAKVQKCTVFLRDMADFAAMNAVYARYFPAPNPPARATVAVAGLPLDARVEIDCVALA